jgi:cytoskeletal protein CcmA (bactofilin family)
MWRKDEPKVASLRGETRAPETKTVVNRPQPLPPPNLTTSAVASPINSAQPGCLTRLLVVKGEITGQDDLVIDGEVHGKIRLAGGKLTIGPDGRVTADIEAPEIVVRGEVKGNIKGRNRVQIAATGKVSGEITTKSIAIEDGAAVHGLRVNLEREERPRPAATSASESRIEKVPVSPTEKASQVHA